MVRKLLILFSFLVVGVHIASAQTAYVKGKVSEAGGKPLELVTIALKDRRVGTVSDAEGGFLLKVPANIEIVCVFKHLGYTTRSYKLLLKPDEEYLLNVALERESHLIDELEVLGQRYNTKREEVSITKVDPKLVKTLPTPFNDFNKILATLPGVVNNNELSSEYSVRGGNFDENLVYVNDIEIYRPFLVRAGQQEGLSFVNPDLVQDVEFSSGGWQARFGDKLSSVLNIQYKEPQKFGGSASVGLLGGTAHLEGISLNKRITYVVGARQKSSKYLLNSLPVQGDYFPNFFDLQSFITIDLSSRKDTSAIRKTTLSILTSYARNRYKLEPKSRETTFGNVFNVKRISVGFEGQESFSYDTYQAGLKLSHLFNAKFKSDFIASVVSTREREDIDVEGGYRFCDVGNKPGTHDFNRCVNERDIGTMYSYSRNSLGANIFNLNARNYYNYSRQSIIEFGGGFSHERIRDRIYEYYFKDSADYVIDQEGFLNTGIDLYSNRWQGYFQHTYDLDSSNRITWGARINYWNINNQLLVSPRVQYSLRPQWKTDIVFKAAVGFYNQPPFYRELRNRAGELNLDLRAQNSVHFIVGSDLNFKHWGRSFKFTSELYFKHLYNVVPYDVDNVRIRYFALNNAKAYAAGADFRIGGELVNGAESWFSLSLLDTREDIAGDNRGYIRRPTNQAFTAAIMLQDHLPRNPTAKMYLNLLFGSGLPYGPPFMPQARAVGTAPFYRRVDLGLSKLIVFNDKSTTGKYLESIWGSIEILNLLGVDNVISYQWIKDVDNVSYGVPNALSARYLNVRIITKF
jgi:hypothetical protein